MTSKLKTAAEIGARMEAIGNELASRGGFPVPNWKQLDAELEQLKHDYRIQLNRESAPPSAETMRQVREADERDARVRKALAGAVK